MRRETLAGGDAILIDDAQSAEAHMVAVVVFAERKRVVSVEPAEVEMTAIGIMNVVRITSHRLNPSTPT